MVEKIDTEESRAELQPDKILVISRVVNTLWKCVFCEDQLFRDRINIDISGSELSQAESSHEQLNIHKSSKSAQKHARHSFLLIFHAA